MFSDHDRLDIKFFRLCVGVPRVARIPPRLCHENSALYFTAFARARCALSTFRLPRIIPNRRSSETIHRVDRLILIDSGEDSGIWIYLEQLSRRRDRLAAWIQRDGKRLNFAESRACESQLRESVRNFSTLFPGLNLGPGCRIFQLNPPCKLALAWPPDTGPRRTFIVRLKFHFVSPQCRRDVHTNTSNADDVCVGHTYGGDLYV